MDRSIRVIADQYVQPIAHGPSGFDNLLRRLISEDHYIRIGASIVLLCGGRNECDVVYNNLKPGFEKGIDRRRARECERIGDKSNSLRQFESPVLRIACTDMAMQSTQRL